MILRTLIASIAIAMTYVADTAHAQSVETIKAVSQTLLKVDSSGDFRKNAKRAVLQIDPAADGLQRSDVDLFVESEGSRTRTQNAYQILLYDLDGDARVTGEEIRRGLPRFNEGFKRLSYPNADEATKRQFDRSIANLMRSDLDKNGVIEGKELVTLQAGRPDIEQGTMALAAFAQALINADPNLDGTVTPAELEKILDTAAATYKDGLRSRAENNELVPDQFQCRPPKIAMTGRSVVVSTHNGARLANVALSPDHPEASAVSLKVENGDYPLSLVLISGSPVVWNIEGDTKRVASVFATSYSDKAGRSLAGIIGIPKERVEFGDPGCLREFITHDDQQTAAAEVRLQRLLGKKPDLQIGESQIYDVSIPSGKLIDRSDLFPLKINFEIDGQAYRRSEPGSFVALRKGQKEEDPIDDQLRFLLGNLFQLFPGGVANLDEKDIVSASPAKKHEIWPGWAGMAQLLQSGRLEAGLRGPYVVRQKIRFPANMGGVLRMTFVVPKGVPRPDGDVMNSCVFIEETGELIGKPSCERYRPTEFPK